MAPLYKTQIAEHTIGDFDAGAEFYLRLFADPAPAERRWVDFQLFEVVGRDYNPDHTPGRKFFNKRDSPRSPDPVYTADEAEILAEGMLKWDGCTQFDLGSVHVDSRDHLRALLAAIDKARELAAAAMGDNYDIPSEYR